MLFVDDDEGNIREAKLKNTCIALAVKPRSGMNESHLAKIEKTIGVYEIEKDEERAKEKARKAAEEAKKNANKEKEKEKEKEKKFAIDSDKSNLLDKHLFFLTKGDESESTPVVDIDSHTYNSDSDANESGGDGFVLKTPVLPNIQE